MSYKILIIEDEKRIRESIVEILEMNDYIVIEAENGEVGIRVAISECPDLIFCDMLMPLIDGMGVLRAIKSSIVAETPFIFLTALAQTEELNTALSFGADGYIFKPFKSKELLDAIKKWL
ncbi:MAG: response regulator [Bacteroidetes bacterium]|nr:response regulator [Bacteroidota bacterium]